MAVDALEDKAMKVVDLLGLGHEVSKLRREAAFRLPLSRSAVNLTT
jgi:hypothetical protein